MDIEQHMDEKIRGIWEELKRGDIMAAVTLARVMLIKGGVYLNLSVSDIAVAIAEANRVIFVLKTGLKIAVYPTGGIEIEKI